ncbi:MAG: S8 family serine peptidase [Ilumatobacteraceae bacterium]
MKNVRRRLSVAVTAGLLVTITPVLAPVTPPVSAAAVAGEYVVTFDADVNAAAKARKERALGNEVSDVFSEAVEGFVATLDANDVRRLRADADVVAVEPNSIIRVAATPGRYIVQLRSGASALSAASAVGATNVQPYRSAITGFAADLTADAYDALATDPNVISIEPDALVRVSDTQLSPVSWGIDRIDQRALPLDRTYTYDNRAEGVRAYVVDTGVRATHMQFGGRVTDGYDGIRDGNGTNDCNGHGSHVAGTIAGVTAGVAKAATVVPVRVLGCNGSGWMSVVIAGIDWVVADHAAGQPAVANLSLGGSKSRIMNAAIARGVADGVTFVVAAGNSNADACNASPASEPTAVTVGASSSNDVRASFSNWGTCLDIFAPGVGITSASHTGDTIMRTLSGTSMAAPHVAGAAALVLGAEPTLSPAQVATRLMSNATANILGAVGPGSPNMLLFTGSADAPTPTTTVVPSTTTTVSPTTSVESTTTVPSTTTTVAPTTTTVAPTTTTTVPRPANDNFANALAIAGASGLVEGSNIYATRETGEPTHGGSGGSASLWYRWTAPSDGSLVVATGSTNGATTSSFDTLLGVYTGPALGLLAVKAVNDDNSLSSGQLWSRVSIDVTTGTAYYIAVDGWGGAKGQVKLSWDFTAIDTTVKPSEPRSVTVSALDASGYVSWLAPTTVGSGTLSYTATASPGGASCSTVGLRCLIGGLVNGTTYTITVTARNMAGEGPASNPPVAFTPNTAANRPVATRAWGVDRIDQRALPLDGSVLRSSTGRAVSIYVIDTGVLATHNEFGIRVTQGRNTIENATNPNDTTDCNGHGTHVAGTAAGQSFGVAPDATIVPVKVLDCYGSGTLAGVVAGIDWMVAHHQAGVPAVANMSLGGSTSVALNSAVARAVADGITVVVAAGNSAMDACTASPASEPLAVTVGATDRYDSRASYSNYGTCVDILAPGSGVLSAGIDDPADEATLSGTSMASPHVAGAAALLLEAAPSLAPADVARLLTTSATRGVVANPGTSTPNLLLFIGSVGQSGADAPTTSSPTTTTAATQPAAAPPASAAPPEPVTTVPADTVAPTTTVPTTTVPVTVAPTTAVASESLRLRASELGALDSSRPQARIVRATPDRVLLRISKARGSVDVLVNGKLVLRTKKRVLVLKSKGIAKKRVTVRASAAKPRA